MQTNRRSLVFRLLVPILLTIVFITGVLALVGFNLIHHIVDDYHHYVASNQAEETRRLYDAALAELTTARLLDNPTVVEAKKEMLLEATALDWQRRGVGGIIVDQNGATLLTTLSPELTSRLISQFDRGFIDLHDEAGIFFGQVDRFHPWGWKIITVVAHESELADKKVAQLIPLLVLGPLLMLGAVLILLRKLRGRWPC